MVSPFTVIGLCGSRIPALLGCGLFEIAVAVIYGDKILSASDEPGPYRTSPHFDAVMRAVSRNGVIVRLV